MAGRGLTVIAFLLLICGCGHAPERGEVEGVVKLHGVPLAGVQVAFTLSDVGEAGNLRSMGVADASGKYRLQCDQGQVGVLAGQYTVVITDTRALPVPGGKQKSRPPTSRVPSQYTSISSTPLKVEVKVGFQTINLDLIGKSGKERSP